MNELGDPRIAAFVGARRRMFGIAYRMLGSAAEADDVIQDAWIRYDGADVRDPEAFLCTVVSRLCLDRLGSARARRESYVGPWLPEPIEEVDDPDTLSLAFLEMAERLSADERAVLVLHEALGYPLADVAGMLDKSEPAVRKTLQRARERLGGPVRQEIAPGAADTALFAFLHAIQSGDPQALVAILRDDAEWISDGGGKVVAAKIHVHGAARVARVALKLTKYGVTGDVKAEIRRINGQPALFASWAGRLRVIMWVTPDSSGKIASLRWLLNPDKLARFE